MRARRMEPGLSNPYEWNDDGRPGTRMAGKLLAAGFLGIGATAAAGALNAPEAAAFPGGDFGGGGDFGSLTSFDAPSAPTPTIDFAPPPAIEIAPPSTVDFSTPSTVDISAQPTEYSTDFAPSQTPEVQVSSSTDVSVTPFEADQADMDAVESLLETGFSPIDEAPAEGIATAPADVPEVVLPSFSEADFSDLPSSPALEPTASLPDVAPGTIDSSTSLGTDWPVIEVDELATGVEFTDSVPPGGGTAEDVGADTPRFVPVSYSDPGNGSSEGFSGPSDDLQFYSEPVAAASTPSSGAAEPLQLSDVQFDGGDFTSGPVDASPFTSGVGDFTVARGTTPVSGVVGDTGNVTVAQVSPALTGADALRGTQPLGYRSDSNGNLRPITTDRQLQPSGEAKTFTGVGNPNNGFAAGISTATEVRGSDRGYDAGFPGSNPSFETSASALASATVPFGPTVDADGNRSATGSGQNGQFRIYGGTTISGAGGPDQRDTVSPLTATAGADLALRSDPLPVRGFGVQAGVSGAVSISTPIGRIEVPTRAGSELRGYPTTTTGTLRGNLAGGNRDTNVEVFAEAVRSLSAGGYLDGNTVGKNILEAGANLRTRIGENGKLQIGPSIQVIRPTRNGNDNGPGETRLNFLNLKYDF